MGADGYTASHVAHYQIQFLVFLVRLAGEAPRYRLLVESMENRLTRQLWHTAQACIRHHFVYHHRIGDKRFNTYLIGNVAGYQTSEIRRMLHAGILKVVAQFIVNFVHATFHRLDNAAAAYDGRETMQIDTFMAKGFLDKSLAPVKLVQKIGETAQFLARVINRNLEHWFKVVVYGNFGRSRPRIDGKYAVHG